MPPVGAAGRGWQDQTAGLDRHRPSRKGRAVDITLFLIFLLATVAAGATGAMFPTGAWYKSLNKPTWVPPNWVFPVVWTSLYLLISFFGLRRLRGSLIVMAGLWVAVAGATVTHFQLDFWAGLAFVPYLVWVSVAAALNVEVARLNPDQKPIKLSQI